MSELQNRKPGGMMERRRRDRFPLPAYCRILPATGRRNAKWKRIEDISGGGLSLIWGEEDGAPLAPAVGDRFIAELQLLAHPVFGERVLQFEMKTVRVFRDASGRVVAGFEITRRRFKSVRPAAWAQSRAPRWVN